MPLSCVCGLYEVRRFWGNVASNLRLSRSADAHYTQDDTGVNMMQVRLNNLNMRCASIYVSPVPPYDHWQTRGLCRCSLRLTSGGQSVQPH